MSVTPDPAPLAERRRQRLSEDERRAQIIDGCLEVLARDGYRRASVARIAQAAGVSKGLVSHYFTDKETLMEQTAIATVGFLQAEVGAAVDLTADVPGVLRAAVHYAARLRQTHSRHEGTLREFDTRVMAVTYQGAIDTMLAYLDAHPDADPSAYADTLADLLLNAMRRRG